MKAWDLSWQTPPGQSGINWQTQSNWPTEARIGLEESASGSGLASRVHQSLPGLTYWSIPVNPGLLVDAARKSVTINPGLTGRLC